MRIPSKIRPLFRQITDRCLGFVLRLLGGHYARPSYPATYTEEPALRNIVSLKSFEEARSVVRKVRKNKKMTNITTKIAIAIDQRTRRFRLRGLLCRAVRLT